MKAGSRWRALIVGALAAACVVAGPVSAAEVAPVSGGQSAAPGAPAAGEPATPEKKADERKADTAPEVTSGAPTAPEGAEKKPEVEAIEPLFVRPLMSIESGRNDSNPVWSPSGALIAFERSAGDRKDIHIALADGTVFQTVYYQLSEGGKDMKFFFPGIVEDVSYNAGITWSPAEDRFVFMSNGGEGNYDLYLTELGGKAVARLTDHREKDGQAHWSPEGNAIIFTSGRTGKGDIYRIDAAARTLTRLTRGDREYLYPQWSPDGKRIAMIGGSNENHDIYVITDITKPQESLKALTSWQFDDIRPVWSPDGKKIAFYSNYNAGGDPKVWSIVVIAGDGSDPAQSEALAAKAVAMEVIPDVERGPAWMPDSARIVYVKDDRHAYNPLYVADVRTRTAAPVRTETKMNHDVSCSADGGIAFRAQVDQWDQIFIMKLKN